MGLGEGREESRRRRCEVDGTATAAQDVHGRGQVSQAAMGGGRDGEGGEGGWFFGGGWTGKGLWWTREERAGVGVTDGGEEEEEEGRAGRALKA